MIYQLSKAIPRCFGLKNIALAGFVISSSRLRLTFVFSALSYRSHPVRGDLLICAGLYLNYLRVLLLQQCPIHAPTHVIRSAIVLNPSTLLNLDQAQGTE